MKKVNKQKRSTTYKNVRKTRLKCFEVAALVFVLIFIQPKPLEQLMPFSCNKYFHPSIDCQVYWSFSKTHFGRIVRYASLRYYIVLRMVLLRIWYDSGKQLSKYVCYAMYTQATHTHKHMHVSYRILTKTDTF